MQVIRTSPRRKLAVAAVTALLAMTAAQHKASAFWGGFDPIIFDPQAFAQHVRQVQQMIRQVAAVKTQIENQLKSLSDLSAAAGDVAGRTQAGIASVRAPFDSALYSAKDTAGQLASRFPQNMTGTTDTQYQDFQKTWTDEYRSALAENRRIQNAVYGGMADTRSQVASIVQASNAAVGEKAAVQAHNDLLATLSGELAKLEALRTSRLRTKAETLARRQSEAAYGDAQGKAVLQGMGGHTPSNDPVTHVFVEE
jgi:P-type conjugative transfer protein TrbJ